MIEKRAGQVWRNSRDGELYTVLETPPITSRDGEQLFWMCTMPNGRVMAVHMRILNNCELVTEVNCEESNEI